jgi:hypothetical protein
MSDASYCLKDDGKSVSQSILCVGSSGFREDIWVANYGYKDYENVRRSRAFVGCGVAINNYKGSLYVNGHGREMLENLVAHAGKPFELTTGNDELLKIVGMSSD